MKPIKEGEKIVLRNVFYEFDSFALNPMSMVELDKVVVFMQANPALKIEIGGHTDNIGTDSHNITLSGRRAEEAMNYLASKGIASERITSKGYGMKEPVASNDTEEGKAKNRRTELKILAK